MKEIRKRFNPWGYASYDGYIAKEMIERYSQAVGEFIMWFSALEDSLDWAIQCYIDVLDTEPGSFLCMELNMSKKINLFYSWYSNHAKIINGLDPKPYGEMKKIYESLYSINKYRNVLAHARWGRPDFEPMTMEKLELALKRSAEGIKTVQNDNEKDKKPEFEDQAILSKIIEEDKYDKKLNVVFKKIEIQEMKQKISEMKNTIVELQEFLVFTIYDEESVMKAMEDDSNES